MFRAGAARRRARIALVALTLACVSSPAEPAAQDWLAVKAWTGSFRIEDIRSLDEKHLFGLSSTGRVRNIAFGTVTFDRKVDPETWAGTGTAVWSVSHDGKLCDDKRDIPCGEKKITGSGEVALGEGTELEISAFGGVYDLWIYPGGEQLEGIEVEYVETPLGGVRFVAEREGPGMTTELETGRSAFWDVSAGEGLLGYLDEEVPLPKQGTLLCGSQERVDGTVVRWKLWPLGTAEPPCEEFDNNSVED